MSLNSSEIGNLDAYTEQLMSCKPLKESEVRFLCEKVRVHFFNKNPPKFIGKRNFSKRKQCPERKGTSHSMW